MRVGVAGLGNVGAATLRLLAEHRELYKRRGQDITVSAVSARNPAKERECDTVGIAWEEDPIALASRSDVDVVVEVIGGAEGTARVLAEAALKNGKHFVTANKALIATHGVELALKAETDHLQLSFEAAVCGGAPVLKMLRESLASNKILSLRGILNGTSNYILTRMSEDGIDFSSALSEAQKQGYAESDPTNDIEGHDAANKLAILTALAFGVVPNLSSIFIEGIRDLTASDLKNAYARKGRIKHLGIAELTSDGVIQRVQPIFLPLHESLARVGGAACAIEVSGDYVGDVFLQASGAGGKATASAIVSDLIDIACGNRNFSFGVPAQTLR